MSAAFDPRVARDGTSPRSQIYSLVRRCSLKFASLPRGLNLIELFYRREIRLETARAAGGLVAIVSKAALGIQPGEKGAVAEKRAALWKGANSAIQPLQDQIRPGGSKKQASRGTNMVNAS